MYVPSAISLLTALEADKSSFLKGQKIEIPVELLKLLIQIALASSDFNEDSYLSANPDVARAVEVGRIESAHLHYIRFGYFEGREGGGPEVDGNWYLRQYPDVAAAIKEGRVRSPQEHFHHVGAAEGRIPNPAQEDDAVQWKKALRADRTV